MTGEHWIGLAEAIQVIRDELVQAQRAGEGQPVRFNVAQIEIDLAVVARRDGGGKAGIQLGVVSLGAQGGLSREETHRLTVTLQAIDAATGRPAEVSGRIDAVPPR